MFVRCFFLLLFCARLFGDALTNDPPDLWPTNCLPCAPPVAPALLPCVPDDNVIINLRNPLYLNGCISTDEGGVLTSKELRIQAMHIRYTKNLEADVPQFHIYCEGKLLIEYKNYVLCGDSLEYDFVTNCGSIRCGKTAFFPWFLEGEEISLLPNGDIIITNGHITTSECGEDEVLLCAQRIVLTQDLIVTATGIRFELKQVPLFALPRMKVDLNTVLEAPVSFQFGWNGFLGTHAGIRYHFLTFGDFKGYARLDGYLGRGLGVGIETEYDPPDDPAEFYTRNYYAHDLSIDDPTKKDRYRVQGSYLDLWWGGTTEAHLLYDYVSDAEFAQDYERDDFALNPAGTTVLSLHRQECAWIANLYSQVRLNSFQTINEELPTIEFGVHPFEIFDTQIISENYFELSYLDYEFSKAIDASNFHSGRFEARPKLYRPIPWGPFKITPAASFVGIAYSNSPSEHSVGQAVLDLEIDAQVQLRRSFGPLNHIVTPYLDYHYLTAPKAPLNNYYIFTIDDAYDRLNILRFGVRNSLFMGCSFPLTIDLWSNAFFDTKTVPQTIPKGYMDLEWQISQRLLLEWDIALNFQHRCLEYTNTALSWTLSENTAFSTEWRHRSRFYNRKANFYNFLLESVRTEQEILLTPISEKRDTFLLKLFHRINPDLATRFELRHGWGRELQPNYLEYHLQLESVLFQNWRVLFSYEKRTEDHRYSIALKLAGGSLL